MNTASWEEIRQGKVTDVYFRRGEEVLRAKGVNPQVVAEVRASSLPRGWGWAVLAGLDEALELLAGLEVDAEAMPEGSVFFPEEPVLVLKGRYLAFGVYETALLGFLCQASGVATVAARLRLAAGGRPVYSFGARRIHPAVSPMVERAAYIGGCDGVASVKSAEILGIPPIGTMAHALILCLGEEEAWRGFDETMPPGIPRIALVDTFSDEKFAARRAAETLGDRLYGVRLDTPRSRRGDFVKILEEVRWELDLAGYEHVKIFVSGGLDEEQIRRYNQYADAYGVGTYLSNAPVVDFALDIVEIEGKPVAKRGKMAGLKQVLRCASCLYSRLVARGKQEESAVCPRCGAPMEPLLRPAVEGGRIIAPSEPASEIRQRVIVQLEKLEAR